MNLRPQGQAREEPSVNLTPLIDVVFLLLIFFMVSTTFRKEAELEIELPEASREPVTTEQEVLEIVVDKSGRYLLNGQLLADTGIETLKQALVDAVGDNRRLPFIIRADGGAAHQAVVRVMDVAGQLGFKRLAIATVPVKSALEPEK